LRQYDFALDGRIKSGHEVAEMFFRILFIFDLIIAAIVVFFFLWGVSDGTVSSFNAGLWFGLLATVAGALLGAYYLNAGGRQRTAIALLLVLAIPGFLYLLFLLFVIIAQPRWN
jgi:hypothetical protein